MSKTALVVFVKEPIAGKVKTRLIPPLTKQEAADLYSLFIQDSFQRYKQLIHLVDIHYFFAPENGCTQLQSLLPEQRSWHPQTGNNLGERMHNAFIEMLNTYRSVLIIGSDHPNLPITYIRKAITVLEYVDISIGPSNDGGYYCIGLKRANRNLFEGINWSTKEVYPETTKRIATEKLEPFILPDWYDIDDSDDLKRFISDTDQSEYPLLYDYLKTIDSLSDLL
ncbi:MAG: TIGR04282 family arsenosugar biosynthesis glycosyltransferase [Calditrichaeota bacterium]|nr:TIGR04282 family arsenosugar biosynthesis glycosyltransferase [Calditrichota bacterium]